MHQVRAVGNRLRPTVRVSIHNVILPIKHHLQVWDEPPCYALDLGAGFGLHAAAMLRLGARVLAVEPLADLCLAAKRTIELIDRQREAHVVCAGIAPERAPPPHKRTLVVPQDTTWYGGHRRTSFALPPVPLYGVEELVRNVPPSVALKLVKIDIGEAGLDCHTLRHVLDLMAERALAPVRNFIVEVIVGDGHCSTVLAEQVRVRECLKIWRIVKSATQCRVRACLV